MSPPSVAGRDKESGTLGGRSIRLRLGVSIGHGSKRTRRPERVMSYYLLAQEVAVEGECTVCQVG